MASSKLAARAMRNHAKYRGRNDLNIVPMIDMMVILVFFLLFTAVFSNTNILELNLPAPNSSVPELPRVLQLEVIVRQNAIEIADRNTGVLRSLPKKDGAYDYEGLSEYLQFVKSKYPTVTAASVLLEAGHSVRRAGADHGQRASVREGRRAAFTKVELFPDISVGDAPVVGAAAAAAGACRGSVEMTPYRIKKHRQRAHHGSHMALVPFIDMLTMLVVFLLLHSSDVEILPNTKNITIPQSVADLKPRETVVIMVTKEDILVNGRSVGEDRRSEAQRCAAHHRRAARRAQAAERHQHARRRAGRSGRARDHHHG